MPKPGAAQVTRSANIQGGPPAPQGPSPPRQTARLRLLEGRREGAALAGAYPQQRALPQTSPGGGSPGRRGRPGGAGGSGTGPRVSAPSGSPAEAISSATASAGPVTAAIREIGGKPSWDRSASSRAA
ncbi:hypothetical protein SANTM175S_05683 [Streptomyces antimycoticus]